MSEEQKTLSLISYLETLRIKLVEICVRTTSRGRRKGFEVEYYARSPIIATSTPLHCHTAGRPGRVMLLVPGNGEGHGSRSRCMLVAATVSFVLYVYPSFRSSYGFVQCVTQNEVGAEV